MKKILYIDTSKTEEIVVIVQKGDKRFSVKAKGFYKASQNTLPAIIKALGKAGLNFADLDEIKINNGPGSYTGLRVGVSIANTISWLLGIKINGKRKPVINIKYS